MHIQEGTITTLTTCTKMTEEVDRRHGVNGNSSKVVTEDAPVHSPAQSATGGRLKFFKDGKFILELVRGGGAGGERTGWVSVPRKTFWPPAAAAPAAPPPCASLSASDDNSSLHSSPWHRDHCWKQPAPRRNQSKELTMYYCRPSTLNSAAIRAASRAKRRRPFDPYLPEPAALPNGLRKIGNGVCDKKRNGDVGSPEARGEDCVDGPDPRTRCPDDDRRPEVDREKYFHMKLKKPHQYHKLRVYRKTKPQIRPKELSRTIDKLRERVAAIPPPVNAKLASCRQEHMMVSPRKRILRELERVTLEEQGGKRRAKTAPALSYAAYPPAPGPSAARAKPKDAPSKNVSSYSIHSLLSMPDASPTRRSPQSLPPACGARSPDLSPSPDSYRYRCAALASPGRSRDSPPTPEPRYRPGAGGAGGAGGARWQYARGSPTPELYAYGYGYAPLYRAPAPLWMHYAMSPALPPGPWAPLAHPLLSDHIPKDEPTSDLPLNLSKH